MATPSPLARRLRVGFVGDGVGPLDASQLGAACSFRKRKNGDTVQQLPVFGAGGECGVAVTRVLQHHNNVLIFDAQLGDKGEAQADTLAGATLWLLNQGVDMIVFCQSCAQASLAMMASLDRCHSVGVTLVASISAAWPASHHAVIGVAVQPHQQAGMHWLGGDACSVIHGDPLSPADAVADVASHMLTGVGRGLVRNDLIAHMQDHCRASNTRRAG